MPAPRKASLGWVRDSAALSAALRAISSPETQAEILEKAVKAACQPILVAAKRYAKRSEQTGALRDSLTIKTKSYVNDNRAVAVGMVGPDRKYRVRGKIAGALSVLFAAAKGNARRPADYAHLVEYGHRIAKGGNLRDKHELTLVRTGAYSKSGREVRRWRRGKIIEAAKGTVAGHVPAKPFLRPALVTTRAQQSAAFEAVVAAAMDSQLRKFNRQAGVRVRYRTAA